MKISLTFKPQHYRALSIIRAQNNPAAFVAKCVLQYVEERDKEHSEVSKVQAESIKVDLSDYVRKDDLDKYIREMVEQHISKLNISTPPTITSTSYDAMMKSEASFFEGAASLFDDD